VLRRLRAKQKSEKEDGRVRKKIYEALQKRLLHQTKRKR
jgi:hypothetical protein